MMMTGTFRRAALAGVAVSALALPAQAQTPREVELEARLAALEAAVQNLRGELERERTSAVAPATPRLPAAEARPSEPRGTSVRLSGFVKTHVALSRYSDGALAAGSTGHDFYNPGMIPLGGASEGTAYRANAKQSRLAVGIQSDVGGQTIKGVIEVDFQSSPGAGNQRVVNAYSPSLRRSFLTVGDWLIGQEWSNFQYAAALPETTDYLGPSEGTVFVRQAQLRYTRRLTPALTLSVAAENPAAVTANAGSAALIEQDSDRAPDLTARLNFALGRSELSLAGLARAITVDLGVQDAAAFGWGVSAAGKVALGNGSRHDLRFMATHGSGIGRYVGLNLAPDAVLLQRETLRLEPVSLSAGFVALRLGWTANLRSTFMGSAQWVHYPETLAVAGANQRIWSASANLFYSPLKPIDLGIEFRHGERRLVSGATGRLDRLEFSAKYSF